MNRYLLLFAFSLLVTACGGDRPPPLPPAGTFTPPELVVETDLRPEYLKGAVGEVKLSVKMSDPDRVIPQGVIFLNVVEVDDKRTYPQASEALFSFAEISDPVFQQLHPGDMLRGGFETTLKFKLKNNAPAGDYLLALQLFRDHNTNPNQVNLKYRMDLQLVSFRVTDSSGDTD